MSSTTPVSFWYQLHYSWGSASALWKKKTNWKRIQKYLWIIPPDINTMKCQLNHSLKVNPLQQLCTSQAYEKKEKKKKKKKKMNTNNYVACTNLSKAQHWWQMRKQASAFHNCHHRSTLHFHSVGPCQTPSERSRPQAEPRTQWQPKSRRTKRTVLS